LTTGATAQAGRGSTRAAPLSARLVLTVLALLAVSELALGLLLHDRLRTDLERDLARRLVHVAKLLASGVDGPLVAQFQPGDERLAIYTRVRARLARQAETAGVERAYVLDSSLRLRVDSDARGQPGRTRAALLANRVELATAAAGTPTATTLYRDEAGQWRLSAFAPLPTPAGLLVGVDASPDFFEVLAALRRRMLVMGALGLALAGVAVFVLLRLRRVELLARRNERLVAMGGMAGALLHEIRNPLAAMTVYLDLLHGTPPAHEARDLAARALAEGQRLGEFLEDVQVFAGLKPLRHVELLASELLADALRCLNWPPSAQLEPTIDTELRLTGDRRLLVHAARNLLGNALEALAGQPGRVRVSAERRADMIAWVVEDSGPGVPAAARHQVFEAAYTTKAGGLGLGLTVVERVAEAHGGSASVAPSPLGGARFVLCLPVAQARGG
jgi:signal transduction histidine kinase